MLTISDSPRHAGIIIRGPDEDFEELYDACHELLDIQDGNENHETDEHWLSLRMLSLCYDLRHKMPVQVGDEKEDEDNTANEGKFLAFPGYSLPVEPLDPKDATEQETNVGDIDDDYDDLFESELSEVRILWPEAIFTAFTLNHYLAIPFFLKNVKKLKTIHQKVEWTVVRKFQLQIIDCLCKTAPPTKEKGIRALYHDEYKQFFRDYCTLFIDKMTVEFAALSSEKRVRELGLIPARIMNKTGDYWGLYDLAHEESSRTGRPPWELRLSLEYTEDIDW